MSITVKYDCCGEEDTVDGRDLDTTSVKAGELIDKHLLTCKTIIEIRMREMIVENDELARQLHSANSTRQHIIQRLRAICDNLITIRAWIDPHTIVQVAHPTVMEAVKNLRNVERELTNVIIDNAH